MGRGRAVGAFWVSVGSAAKQSMWLLIPKSPFLCVVLSRHQHFSLVWSHLLGSQGKAAYRICTKVRWYTFWWTNKLRSLPEMTTASRSFVLTSVWQTVTDRIVHARCTQKKKTCYCKICPKVLIFYEPNLITSVTRERKKLKRRHRCPAEDVFFLPAFICLGRRTDLLF